MRRQHADRAPREAQRSQAKRLLLGAAFALLATSAIAAGQHDHHMAPDTGAEIRPGAIAKPANLPGKALRTLTVIYAPGGYSPPHRHAASAFIYAQVLEGAIESQVEGQPSKVYKAGEFWTEQPGDHHLVSRNASATVPAKLLVILVVDAADGALTTPDP
jgi:quercetin dioxygenase-like cupin family protein